MSDITITPKQRDWIWNIFRALGEMKKRGNYPAGLLFLSPEDFYSVLNANTVSAWTSVEDELPESHQHIIFEIAISTWDSNYKRIPDTHEYKSGYFVDGLWVDDWDEIVDKQITRWTTSPEDA